MTGSARPWEVGSAFTLPTAYAGSNTPWPSPARLFGSGRQALVALLRFGARKHGWSAAHLPAYFCPPVAEAARDVLPVLPYDGGPAGGSGPTTVGPTEVVVAVSYFGMPPVLPSRRGAALVVDATHDPRAPWLADLDADFVLASLRKTLPLPDGGLLWSPAGRSLPAPTATTRSHQLTVGRILTGMLAKAAYLGGARVPKESYLALLRAGEEELATPEVSGASEHTRLMLSALPADELRTARVDNAHRLAAGLAGLPGVTVRAYPLGVVCQIDGGDRREEIRRGLVARDIYPAVLWALPDTAPAAQLDLSRRMLFLPTDHRYGSTDMDRVAAALREVAHPTARPQPTATETPSSTAAGPPGDTATETPGSTGPAQRRHRSPVTPGPGSASGDHRPDLVTPDR
ncbi:hypothetical protein [Micromonospora sp. RTGN7]|uniref:hypothetical protein n=1 Tax=Micromonospora sp. RTGN7 TaxID=3016526 RepID=UPI0029FED966|nr:hypothetical protein [Micromonospora sp. RTGN7]